MLVQGPVAEPETWLWELRPKAASQSSWTRQMFLVTPRSTWIHCGSANVEAQRVPVALPSTARFGVVPAFSLDDEVAGRLSARLVVLHVVTAVLVRVAVAGG